MSPELLPALKGIPLLSDLTSEQLQALAELGVEQHFDAGDVMVAEGSPADAMFILLEGEIEARANDKALYMARAGEVTGKLPHSRMVSYPRTVRAATAVWQLTIPESAFTEMFQRAPSLELKLIRVMADRIRNSTADEVQQSKLAALG